MKGPKVALVHEWLVGWGGAESVLRSMVRLFPDAPVFTSVWKPDERVREAFGDVEVRTSFLQRLPGARHRYRWLLPLLPRAFDSFDLSGFDLVVSSSHAFSKHLRVPAAARHVCYCHTPPRYVWGFGDDDRIPGRSWAAVDAVILGLRARDAASGARVDGFLANSAHVASRIEEVYGRTASVLHPPVDVERFAEERGAEKGGYFLAGGRLVPYKAVHRAVEAATLGGLELVVFGEGPERGRLEAMAGPTVRFTGRVSDERLRGLLAGARAYLFPGEEDFGILPVESQAAGTPVVALDRGGARETVIDGVTGILYPEPSPGGLLEGIRRLEATGIDRAACGRHAAAFGRTRFEKGLEERCRSVLERRIVE